jgi:glutamate racemase
VVERFSGNVTLLQNTCPGLVQQIERGELNSSETRIILESALRPMLERGIDTIVLGCTHYPFVIPVIEEIVGPEVRVIDPAPAVARQVARLLDSTGRRAFFPRSTALRYFTSGEAIRFEALLSRLLDETGEVQEVFWDNKEIHVK